MAKQSTSRSAVQQFLTVYEKEHAITMKVLRAFPAERADLQPHPMCKTAKDLAWVFVLERGLGTMLMENAFADGPPSGEAPKAPDTWEQVLEALEEAHAEFAKLVSSYTDAQLEDPVTFLTGPQQMGTYTRGEVLWFLLHDQIHHRGQFSIYLRMADGKVPSIYGPSGDEPWM